MIYPFIKYHIFSFFILYIRGYSSEIKYVPRWPDNSELQERNHDIPLTAMQIVNVLKIKFTFRYNKPPGSNQKEIQQNYINLSNISPLLLL